MPRHDELKNLRKKIKDLPEYFSCDFSDDFLKAPHPTTHVITPKLLQEVLFDMIDTLRASS